MATLAVDVRAHYEAFLSARAVAEVGWFRMGSALGLLFEEKAHKVLGFDTWATFIEAPQSCGGCGLTLRTAERLILNGRWAQQLQIPEDILAEVGHTKIDIIRPHLTIKNRQDVLSAAQALSAADLARTYRGTGGASQEIGENLRQEFGTQEIRKEEPEKVGFECPKCGHRWISQ